MTIEWYDRTWEQNEDLGLNDMKVENYEEDASPPTKDAPSAPESKDEKPASES